MGVNFKITEEHNNGRHVLFNVNYKITEIFGLYLECDFYLISF